MDVILASLAALVASWLAFDLFRTWRLRRRLHAEAWSWAFAAYGLATWALVYGLALGWTSLSFRSFYFLGAIANISLLAVGAIALASEPAGRRAMRLVTLWLVFGFFASFLAPFTSDLSESGIPDGSDVFDFVFSIDALTLPGPRLFAAVSGAVATIVIVALAIVTVVRSWSSLRRLAYGNLLIVVGALIPALGGSLTALGESAALSLTLLVGIVALWAGYRLASTARATTVGSHSD